MEHRELLATIGVRIKELRKARGWTQEALARKARVTADFLGKAERGHKEPSLYVLLKLATVLGVSPAYLLMPGTPEQAEDRQALDALLSARSSTELAWLTEFVRFLGEHPMGGRLEALPAKRGRG